MSYETLLQVCQLTAMIIFGGVMVGILTYAFRPANRARFEAASRLALQHDEDMGKTSDGA